MTIDGKIIKNDAFSKAALMEIFDLKENPIACANYGNGLHCNEARVDTKTKLWGERGESSSEDACKVARILFIGSEPVAMLNIGTTGNPPTVIDRLHKAGLVYELSGAMVKDAYFVNGLHESIVSDISSILNNCIADKNYTKAIVSFIPNHPYQEELLSSAGCIKLTPENIDTTLGVNALHPERFKFEQNQSYECQSWNKSADEVTHEGWHPSSPCDEWTEKTVMVMDMNAQCVEEYPN